MNIVSMLLSFVLVAAPSAALAQPSFLGEEPRPSILTYAAEGVGGLILGAGGLALGIGCAALLSPVVNSRVTAFAALCIPGVTAAAGVAGGTYLVGAAFQQYGEFNPTMKYAAVGAIPGVGLAVAGSALAWDHPGTLSTVLIASGVTALAASPILATWGYNRSRVSYAGRILPGSFACGWTRNSSGTHLALNARLLTVRL